MINIMTFNEWKESPDYLVQQFFINKKITIQRWFEDGSLSGLEFDYFEYDTTNSLYDMYAGELYFNEDQIQWTMQILIDAEKLTDGAVEEVKLVLKGYSVKTQEQLGVLERIVDEPEIVPDLLIELINEFKIENTSEDDKD